MPQRRDCQCTPVILVGGGGTIIAGGIGNSGGGIYCGSNSISISGSTISAIFGTGSTQIACGSHLHTGTYLPIAGCAADSCKLNGQTPSDITSNLTTGQVLYYDGTTIRSCAISSGNVNKVGTPADNQIGTWTGDGTIEGFSGFTYNGKVLVVAGNVCMGQLLFISAPTGNPEFDFREGTTTRAKTYYDVTNNRLTFQNNENNNQDALYFADHVTTTGNITIGGCLIAPAIKITTGAAAGCVLTSSADGTAAWCTPTGGASCLDALTDVVVSTPSNGHILTYTGGTWCNKPTTALSLTTGCIVCYNGTTLTNVGTIAASALPIASTSCIGGVKIGTGLSIDGAGCLCATAGSTVGYAINVHAANLATVADACTYYFGGNVLAPLTTADRARVYIPKTGAIKAAYIFGYSSTAGTGEAWAMCIRKNNTTDTLIQSLSSASSSRVWGNTSLNISVSAGDYIEIKTVFPTWATNPANLCLSGQIYIE